MTDLMTTVTDELPEHRACRSTTPQERRGAEARRGSWRLGESNWRNLYVGNRHVGVVWVEGLPEQIVAAMNVQHAITWDTTCVGCADRLDDLITERNAGADEAARAIIRELCRLHGEGGSEALLDAVAVAMKWTANGSHSAQDASEPVPRGSAVGAPA